MLEGGRPFSYTKTTRCIDSEPTSIGEHIPIQSLIQTPHTTRHVSTKGSITHLKQPEQKQTQSTISNSQISSDSSIHAFLTFRTQVDRQHCIANECRANCSCEGRSMAHQHGTTVWLANFAGFMLYLKYTLLTVWFGIHAIPTDRVI